MSDAGPSDAASSRVVVVGASIAGLLAARVLSDWTQQVVVLERDQLSANPAGSAVGAENSADAGVDSRRGTPQARHAHALLAAGVGLLEQWFPGVLDELVAHGAVVGDGGDAIWWHAGGYRIRREVGLPGVGVSRALLEHVVRERVRAITNVELTPRVRVDGLLVRRDRRVNGGARIVGVRFADTELHADLVVDASGRDTRLVADATAAGFPAPPLSEVRIDVAYSTAILPRRAGDLDATYCIIAATPPAEPRFAALLPIEGDRWMLTMGGYHGDAAPTDPAGFAAFARSLPSPVVADLLDRVAFTGPIASYRVRSNQRRHVERLRRPASGYLLIGDAIASFNPIYAQGMTSAAQQAAKLGDAACRHPLGSTVMIRAFYRAAGAVVNNPWQIAAGSDFLHPKTTGDKPPGTSLINRYLRHVHHATHVSETVLKEMHLVQNLLAPPPSLMKPQTLLRVLRAANRSQLE